ncbi:protein mono-ADP-ribosyltransferase PARP14-like [Montipora capricornis]|uniref:protein mono-ADP-ribosyltransferase PARP14-like n=1 Tax=Montipora capricornis TaxID=246305 RepID=UPI0035F1E629
MSSIAFPVIGTGNLKFPPNEASRIMLEEILSFCQTNASSTLKDIRFVVYQQDQALITAFKQEMANLQSKHNLRQVYTTSSLLGKLRSKLFGIRTAASSPGLSSEHGLVGPSNRKYTGPSIEVINADLTQETTDAILNIISTDMNMSNAGELSKAILKQGGSQIQQECSQLGNQVAGSAVMTNGGSLAAPKVIHIIPGSSDKQHLQTCLEAGLRLADKHKLRSLSLPCVGTGGYGLAAADSAQVTFQALNNFILSCQNVRKVRIVVFQASMMQEFLQAQQRYAAGIADHKLESNFSSEHTRQTREYERTLSVTNDPSLKICVAGKDATSVQKAVDSLKSGFSEVCMTQKVENEAVNQLSRKQIDSLRKKANDCDVRLDIEADIDRILVRGEPTEVTGMVGEIWHEINERNKKIKEEQQALLVSKNIEWSYEIQGAKMVFDLKTNAKLEMAHVKSEAFVRVSLRADDFDINLKAKTGQGRQNRETITIHRKVKGSDEGNSLPDHWDPMPSPGMTVHSVPIAPGSSEYQTVASKFQLTGGGSNIKKIERVQNPHLYQSYVVRKQKMDQDNGGNNERQLFHGTDAKNVTAINTQGFNRGFSGVHGVALGRGVYFARDASYSAGFARGGTGSRCMYLARVLVGQYCVGNSAMIVPPPKNPSRPEILYESVVDNTGSPSVFVVFYDSQCYPEYLITF